ncbi:hypothetical protein GOBAR_DD33443 [Gossypium barbadense]|nr:hypothetical protein GOBAR_DD33443 [Gossypium barbadense]
MEESIAGLPIADEEEETILLGLHEGEDPMSIQLYWVDFWMLIYDLLHGFLPKAIAKQLGSFIGVFLEYDALAIQLGYKRIMRLRV